MKTPNYRFARPRPVPLIMTLCASLLLFSLGVWQLERLHWKEELIAQLNAALAAAPRELLSIPESELTADEFTRVTFLGRARPLTPVYMAARYHHSEVGYHVLLPVDILGAKKRTVVLVNMGWIPSAMRGKMEFATAPTHYSGMIRLMGRKNAFTPDNQLPRNLWFWYDHAAMEDYTRLKLLPIVIDRLEMKESPSRLREGLGEGKLNSPTRPPPQAGEEKYPIGFTTAGIHLRNDHLQYAFIWFSLTLACVAVFVLYHVRRNDNSMIR